MNLETDRLLLRPFCKSDLDDLALFSSDEETMRFVSAPLTREQVAGVIDWFMGEWNRLGYGWFAVMEKPANRLIGQCGLQSMEGSVESTDAELAFVIDRKKWGRGYAVEAAREVIKFGFGPGGLQRIVAVTLAENLPPQQILSQLGFRRVDINSMHEPELTYYELTKTRFLADATQHVP